MSLEEKVKIVFNTIVKNTRTNGVASISLQRVLSMSPEEAV